MDHKPLLPERAPAYNLEPGQGDFACGPHGYGAIPTAPPPPPYPYLVAGGPGAPGAGPRVPRANFGPRPAAAFNPASQLFSGRRAAGAQPGADPGPERGSGGGPTGGFLPGTGL